MKAHRQELVYAFIERYRLHVPGEHHVNLADLRNVFRPIFHRRLPNASMLMLHEAGTGDARPQIWLRRDLGFQDMRLAYIHELMHWTLGHDASMPLYKVNPWFYNRDEREAWMAAAMVLIPRATFFQSPDERWLMTATDTPDWLVRLMPLTRQYFAFPQLPRPAVFR